MRLKDHGNGITRDSLQFFREHRHQLGEIVEASVRFPGFEDPYDPYLMVLRDDRGDEMLLSGCTAGYPGEGPRGAMEVLVEAGWPADQAALVFHTATLRLERHTQAAAAVAATRAMQRSATSPSRSASARARGAVGIDRS